MPVGSNLSQRFYSDRDDWRTLSDGHPRLDRSSIRSARIGSGGIELRGHQSYYNQQRFGITSPKELQYSLPDELGFKRGQLAEPAHLKHYHQPSQI